jgi:hypothetical protein
MCDRANVLNATEKRKKETQIHSNGNGYGGEFDSRITAERGGACGSFILGRVAFIHSIRKALLLFGMQNELINLIFGT